MTTPINRITGAPHAGKEVVAGIVVDPARRRPYIFPARSDDDVLLDPADATTPVQRLDEYPDENADLADLLALGDLTPGEAHLGDDQQVPLHVTIGDERVRPLPEDLEVIRRLPHLETVMWDPASRLLETTLKVPAARSRRPARRAEVTLAASSGDWLRRRYTSIIPRRILDRRLEHDLGLYDNLVASALVHLHLPSWLRKRLRSLHDDRGRLRETWAAFSTGTHHRLHRMVAVLHIDKDEAQQGAEAAEEDEAVELLHGIRRRMHRLLGSPLASDLGPADVGDYLTMTNRMGDDQHYRHLPPLWRLARGDRRREDLEVVRDRAQVPHHNAVVHVVTLTIHALEQLGYLARPTSDVFRRGEQMRLEGPWSPVTLTWEVTDVLTVQSGDRTRRLIPLAVDLPAVVEEHGWRAVRDVLGPMPAGTHLLHRGGTQRADEMRKQLRSDGFEEWERLVVVEPWSAGSAERVGRILLDVALSAEFLTLPVEIRVDGEPVAPALREHLAWPDGTHAAGGGMQLTAPVQAPGRAAFEKSVRTAAGRARARGSRGWERDHANALARVSDALDEADASLRKLLRCPVCGQESDERNWHWDGSSVQIVCDSCRAQWGTSRCGACGTDSPVLHHAELISEAEKVERTDGWVERHVGRDVLAEPCWSSTGGRPAVICTSCDACPESSRNPGCPRCHDQSMEQ